MFDYFSTRIKLRGTDVVKLRFNNGSVVASKEIKVAIGGMSVIDFDDASKRSASWSFIKEAHAASDLTTNSEVCQLGTSIESFDKNDDDGKSIKMRAKLKQDVTEAKVMIMHPMETGLRKDRKTGTKIPAHYIRGLAIMSGSELIVVDTNATMSKNPVISVRFNGGRVGSIVYVAWEDNTGAGSVKSLPVK